MTDAPTPEGCMCRRCYLHNDPGGCLIDQAEALEAEARALRLEAREIARFNSLIILLERWSNLGAQPTREPIRVPENPTSTKFCTNRNWNRRGAHVSKERK